MFLLRATVLGILLSGAVLWAQTPPPLLDTPRISLGRPIEQPAEAQPAPSDRPLAINLATALRLADARPLVVAAAQMRILEAAARLEKANVLWVPNLNVGTYIYNHSGGAQQISGAIAFNGRTEFIGGAGLTAIFAFSDAIFEPLAARQVLRSRTFDLQATRNDVLLDVAEAYFAVQQARGRYAGYLDTVARARDLVERVEKLARSLTPPLEIDRARTQLAELEQSATLARQDWRLASANLTRLLRLDPAAVVVPLEPPHLQVTIFAPEQSVDALIPVGLLCRPELASQQALVRATLERLRQEKLRPLIPSVLLTGSGTPQFFFNGGVFGTGRNGNLTDWAGRSDVALQLVWHGENLGLGNRARIRERDAQSQLAIIDLFRIQDTVAAEVAQTHAQLEAAAARTDQAARGLDFALSSFNGNLKGLSETTRFGNQLQLVIRPQEVVAALTQLQTAYGNYYLTIADYNRSQFRLFRALGYPAHLIACEKPTGPIIPVNTDRPYPQLPTTPSESRK